MLILAQVCIMIHSGSRGLGHQVCVCMCVCVCLFVRACVCACGRTCGTRAHTHVHARVGPAAGTQVATDALVAMEKAMARDKITTNDRQLACARVDSQASTPLVPVEYP